VLAGLTPLEALQSATVRPAEYFSLQDEMGSINVGMRADMLLLDASPLENIANTKQIAGVVTKGKYLDRAALNVLIQTAQEAER
jgi:imidazolonepropionase-like amidohydrolase